MKEPTLKRRPGERIAITWRVFAVALVLGSAAPAVGSIVVPTRAEAQLSDLRQVKRFIVWDICTRVPCMGGYCCGWAGF